MVTTTTTLVEQVEALTRRVEELERRLASEANLPEECRKRECDYYGGYLAYGGPDLTHEGYHAAVENFSRHADACTTWSAGRICSICLDHERRIRA